MAAVLGLGLGLFAFFVWWLTGLGACSMCSAFYWEVLLVLPVLSL